MKKLTDLVPEYRHRCVFIRKYFIDRILKSIEISEIKNRDKILDLGCGEGFLLKKLIEKGIDVDYVGVDINENIKELKFKNARFYVWDITKGLNFDTESFDIVFALDVLEHILDFNKLVDEIHRILIPKGKLVVCGPTETLWYKFVRFIFKGTFSSKEGPDSGEHFYNIKQIKQIILNSKKFKIDKETYLPEYLPKFLAGVWILRFIKIDNEK